MRVVIALCRHEKTTIFNLKSKFIDKNLNYSISMLLKNCFLGMTVYGK